MRLKDVYSQPQEQIKRWRALNDWLGKAFSKEVIPDKAFTDLEGKVKGIGAEGRIFYGFGEDGGGNADPLLSGHIFVSYLIGKHPYEISRFVDFFPSPPDPSRFDYYRPKIKMREGAAARPRGFYIKTLPPKDLDEGIGMAHVGRSPADVRKLSPWGWGPEGFQFLAVEEEYVGLLIERKVPIFVLADYAISPYGEADFSSAPFLGTDRSKLEIGTMNVRDTVPKFHASHFI